MEKKKYPIGAENYVLYEEIGHGVSAAVHRALCIPFDEIVAIKILDFERDNTDLSNISREVQTMILVDHPNVLKSHCSFVSEHTLWVVMPFMAGGSCLHILKAAYPDGFEETVIATVLREVLKGLEYLHHHGHIHRDVKAGNILLDARGAVKLGDFGVAACLFDSGDRQRMRNTFVGTPCWMAPEVMEQVHGYDFKADIWSFGITALELAHGHAPFSKYPPMKVLLMTLQNAPPGLDYERDRKFSKSFKQMIASCLVKDPSKRPSAKKLLKHSFFKQARSNDYISRTLLEGLPALGDRIEALKKKEEDMLAQKKMPDGQKEEISQNEYKRGISSWNFNLDDMKAQASLIQDVEDSASENNHGGSSSSLCTLDAPEKQLESESQGQVPEMDGDGMLRNGPAPLQMTNSFSNMAKIRGEKSDDELFHANPSCEHRHSFNSSQRPDIFVDNNVTEKTIFEINGKQLDSAGCQNRTGSQLGGSNLPDNAGPPVKEGSDKLPNQSQNGASPEFHDALPEIQPRAPKLATPNNDDDDDDKAKTPVVQQRGRFKVTSENVGVEKVHPLPVMQKSPSTQVLHQSPGLCILSSPNISSSILNALSVYTQFYSILQSNIAQRDNILGLMRHLCDPSTNCGVDIGNTQCSPERPLVEASNEKEKEMLNEIIELQHRLIRALEEFQKHKAENAQV